MTDLMERGHDRELVEVWSDYTQRWTAGFAILERVNGGYVLCRDGDESKLPAVIPASRVRAGRPVSPGRAGEGFPNLGTTV